MEHQKDHQTAFPDLELVFVEGGSFTMGDNESEYDFEKPAHRVEVASFYMDQYPVTQRLWQAVMGNNPSLFQGKQRPVEQVSWDDAQDFIEKLNRETGKTFRLPTESEWEYAARGGSVFNEALGCRSTFRGRGHPAFRDRGIGFRMALPLQSVD